MTSEISGITVESRIWFRSRRAGATLRIAVMISVTEDVLSELGELGVFRLTPEDLAILQDCQLSDV